MLSESAPIESDLQTQLTQHGITCCDEVGLRLALEERVSTYTLYKLADWPARRWKCHYRLMMGPGVYDAQTVPEAYARALLAVLQTPTDFQEEGHTTKEAQ